MEGDYGPDVHKLGRFAASLRGFGPVGILAILLVIVGGAWIGAALVLVWAWYTGTPWRELGLFRPRSWLLTIILGMVGGVALKLLMKSVVMPLLGAPDMNPAFQYLVHNTGALPGILLTVIISAGFGEELVWRGFLFERLGHLIGRSTQATVVTVFITSALFGLAHYQSQRWMGVEQAFIVGLIVGSVYAKARNLWPLIVLHATFDIVGVFIIYWGLEARIAHLLL